MGNEKRYILAFSYLGTAYVGFQSQGTDNAVQDKIESAISKIANHPVKTICAGRTDKGVHALIQIVHFDSESERTEHQWLRGINANLPRDIRALWVQKTSEKFHARFSAVSRAYVYYLNTQPDDLVMSPYTWTVSDLDINRMEEALPHLLGEQDFYAFQSRHCQAEHSRREIQAVSIEKIGKVICFHIQANAFLHHMVRKIVATLVKIGEGKLDPDQMKVIIETKDRDAVPGQAPAKGLFLKQVQYASEWKLNAIGRSQLLGG